MPAVVRHAGVIQGATIFFRDQFGDRDGSWRARACEGTRAEISCVRGSRRACARGVMVYMHKGCLDMDMWDGEIRVSKRSQDGLTRGWDE